MASKFARDRGYEEDRFEFPVSENFKCAICLNVLNNPKSCRNNQHYFCFGCIGQHLENSHTCPECMDELNPATLVEPPRVLLNCILELRIKCGYSDRGCPQHIQLGRLQSHVDQCGFAPAKCGNEGCGADVNKCEKVRHETELCKFRKVECYGCGELKKEMQELKRSQEKANKNLEETRKEMDEKQKEVDRKMAVMMENQLRIKEGVKEMRIAMVSSLDKMENVLNDAQIDSPPTQGTQASKRHVVRSTPQFGPPINHDVIIMGGLDKDRKPTNSVEKFCCKEGRWVDLAPMIVPRQSASSVVLDNQVIVSGGRTNTGQSDQNVRKPTVSIEILNLSRDPLKWAMSAAKLPVPLFGHQTFVYKGKLIVICHYYIEGKGTMCKIFEIPLTPPHAAKELHTLPNSDRHYKAELVNKKIFLYGGKLNDWQGVLIYDLVANECREMPGLPFCMYNMSTVLWGDQIVLLGGMKKVLTDTGRSWDDKMCDEAIMYDTETGESEMLPSMKHERKGCSAVLTDDVIVVMGGHYNSVEYYDFRTNTWQAFKAMKERRFEATAVVSPL